MIHNQQLSLPRTARQVQTIFPSYSTHTTCSIEIDREFDSRLGNATLLLLPNRSKVPLGRVLIAVVSEGAFPKEF